jgi:hypothetical protein
MTSLYAMDSPATIIIIIIIITIVIMTVVEQIATNLM